LQSTEHLLLPFVSIKAVPAVADSELVRFGQFAEE